MQRKKKEGEKKNSSEHLRTVGPFQKIHHTCNWTSKRGKKQGRRNMAETFQNQRQAPNCRELQVG